MIPDALRRLRDHWRQRFTALTSDGEVMRDDLVKARMLRDCITDLDAVLATVPGEGPEPPRCLCGTDEAIARGDHFSPRLDIYCPKHDAAEGRAPEPPTAISFRQAQDHDRECESELTSHGYTPCRCEERAAVEARAPQEPPALSHDDIDQIVEGIEHFIISGDDDLVPVWQPYIDKLNALKSEARPAPPLDWQPIEQLRDQYLRQAHALEFGVDSILTGTHAEMARIKAVDYRERAADLTRVLSELSNTVRTNLDSPPAAHAAPEQE